MAQPDFHRSLAGHELSAALRNLAFRLHYQPIRATQDLELVAHEALLRWPHPVRGMVPPTDFIPLAERSGLIHDLGLWVLRQSCRDLTALDSRFLSINVSPVQLLRPDFATSFARTLKEEKVEPAQITVEITEGVALTQNGVEHRNLRALHEIGCDLAIDDFGTGYATFEYLDRFPFNVLKIDKSFTSRLGRSPKVDDYVASLCELGRDRNISTVAEGVETQEQLAILRGLGCSRVQGYLLGKPAAPQTSRAAVRFAPKRGRAPPGLPWPLPAAASERALLEAVIENVPAMLFVKDMGAEGKDDERWGRYVLLNRAGEQMLGCSRAELIGRSDRELFPSEAAERFRHNDGMALRLGSCIREEAAVENSNTGTRQLRTRKLSLSDAETGLPRYVLGISEDVTERLEYLDALHERNRQFDVAIEGMSHGLCMVDADERMIVCNAHYLKMFGLAPDVVRPGTAFVDVLRHSVETGTATQSAEELYAIRKRIIEAGKPVTYYEELADGRVIAISHRPMPLEEGGNGASGHGGWVSIYEDVTRQRQAEQALQEQNRRFNAALDNMGQGLCMFDAEGRLLVYNNSYLAMFGLSHEDLEIGESSEAIIERLVARGCYTPGVTAKDISESMHASLLHEEGPRLQLREMSDGRVIAASFRPMTGGGWVSTFEDVTERRRSEQQIAHMARHDALTDLPNRNNFQERIDQAVDLANRGETVAVFYIDLDGFKTINDTLGHEAGDQYLKAVAERLRRCVRSTDVIARLGGDEFAVIQTGISDPADAGLLAERLLDAASEHFEIYGRRISPRMSIGIAIAPFAGTQTDDLMRKADVAMYRSKADGGHTYRFFAPGMSPSLQTSREH